MPTTKRCVFFGADEEGLELFVSIHSRIYNIGEVMITSWSSVTKAYAFVEYIFHKISDIYFKYLIIHWDIYTFIINYTLEYKCIYIYIYINVYIQLYFKI